MPNGNVGTPTKVFLKFIKSCRLPPKVISKLGLAFPRTRTNKIYSKMAYDYGGVVEDGPPPEDEVLTSARGHELMSERDRKLETQTQPPKSKINSDEAPFSSLPETSFVGAFLVVVYGFAFSRRCVFATWRVLASVALTRDRPYYNIYCSRLRLNLHGEWGIN